MIKLDRRHVFTTDKTVKNKRRKDRGREKRTGVVSHNSWRQ